MRLAVFWMLFVPFFHSFRLYVARYASATGNASMPEISGVCLGIIAAIAFRNALLQRVFQSVDRLCRFCDLAQKRLLKFFGIRYGSV